MTFRVGVGVGVIAVVSTVACVGGCRHEPAAEGPGHDRTPRMPGAKVETTTKVGNTDPSGVDNQPNWDAMAQELRVRVHPRLPDPLPADAPTACATMLDAARSFYTNTEPDPGRRQARLDELAATRQADERACIETTSIQAAACVTVLLSDRDSEFPWLLDQCMRAYPRDA